MISDLSKFFISEIASMANVMLAGTFRSLLTGPNTGLSVSKRMEEIGSCLTSFCFCLERMIEGGIEKK